VLGIHARPRLDSLQLPGVSKKCPTRFASAWVGTDFQGRDQVTASRALAAKQRLVVIAAYSAPTILKLLFTNTWCGQFTPMM
jgi:hypothetical protein